MDDIEEIVDVNGNIRRLGSLVLPDNFVSAFPTTAGEFTPYDDKDILRLVRDPNRVPARKTFGRKWVVNQRSVGSCNGWLASQLLHKTRWMMGSKYQDGLLLSGAYVYSKINGGQDRGSILEDGMRAIQKWGAAPASLVTWDMIYPKQQPKNADAEAAKHKGFNPMRAPTIQDVKTLLGMQRPVGIAIQAGRGYQTLNKKGIAGVDNGRGNHAILADDLVEIDGDLYMDHAGSWDLTYGEEGRAYLHFDSVMQTMNYHVFYTIGSTVEAE